MKAYYFSQSNKRLRYGDNRLIRKGATHTFKGEPALCERGLHASVDILDALNYAPGPVVCEVRLGGKIVKGADKCAATKREYLSVRNVERELRIFAAECAERALLRECKAGRELPDASWNAVAAAYLYAKGFIDDNALEAARAAAREAARDAARYAAREAARDAAWDAARAAASAAAWNTAWAAERRWQRKRLMQLLFPKKRGKK